MKMPKVERIDDKIANYRYNVPYLAWLVFALCVCVYLFRMGGGRINSIWLRVISAEGVRVGNGKERKNREARDKVSI